MNRIPRHHWIVTRISVCCAATCIALSSIGAQQADSTHKISLPSLDFSGTLFTNYQYRVDPGPLKSSNKFDLERAYLTFRIPAGERLGVRITADVFQSGATGETNRGWLFRAKYAYLQYDYLKRNGWSALARLGVVQTVFIEHEETFWPRFIAPGSAERAGLFSSADGGLMSVVTFPRKRGELYVGIANGPGYTARETDRFKDYSARLSLTPLGEHQNILRTLTLTGWIYRGAMGSQFTQPVPGQAGTFGHGLPRNRWGIFTGIKDPRLVLGAHYATRTDASESGANTQSAPRIRRDSSGTLASGYFLVRPFRLAAPSSPHSLGLFGRWDDVRANRDAGGAHYQVVISGLIWDMSSRVSMSADYQEQARIAGPTVGPSRTYYLHLIANF